MKRILFDQTSSRCMLREGRKGGRKEEEGRLLIAPSADAEREGESAARR